MRPPPYLPPTYLLRKNSFSKRISFIAYGENSAHRGTIYTVESVDATLRELEKDYDVVILNGVKIADYYNEKVTIYDNDTNEKLI